MLGKLKNIGSETVVAPLKRNLTSVMFWSGVVLIIIGTLFGEAIDSSFMPKGTGDAILKSGSAILGAGVFAVIMKTIQFTEIFQKHIFDVFYKPQNFLSTKEIHNRWIQLTSSLLKPVLPFAHDQAANRLNDQFLTNELQYHFEKFVMTYDIKVSENGNEMTIIGKMEADLVLSPRFNNPILEQGLEVGGESELIELRINGDVQNLADFSAEDSNKPQTKTLTLELKEFTKQKEGKEVKTVEFERSIKMTQMLDEEPYIAAAISRYIKGATVKAKITDGYSIHFKKTGLETLPKDHYSLDKATGHHRWVLARPKHLLLPGQGYILIVTPTKKHLETK